MKKVNDKPQLHYLLLYGVFSDSKIRKIEIKPETAIAILELIVSMEKNINIIEKPIE